MTKPPGKPDAETLALVAKYSSNAVVILDPQDVILWVNDSYTRLTGWTAEEVIGRHPGNI